MLSITRFLQDSKNKTTITVTINSPYEKLKYELWTIDSKNMLSSCSMKTIGRVKKSNTDAKADETFAST